MAAADRAGSGGAGNDRARNDSAGNDRASGEWSGPAWAVRSAVRAFRRQYPGLGDGDGDGDNGVCVALSGGADSLALTAAAAAEFGSVEALVVDHGLQSGSDEVARNAVDAARAVGAPGRVLVVVVDRGGEGPEAAARTARYAALNDARRGRPVLLAHTLDDQAETVLLGLGRGSGARSLHGMAAWDAPWGRPLLGVRAIDTRAACSDLGLRWWEDPHNVDPTFTRVRIRREVLPLLEDVLGGGVAESLARTAGLLRVDDDELERLAAAVPVEGADTLDVSDLTPLPEAVLTRVLRRWLRSHGVASPIYAHLTAIAALITGWRGQGGVAVGGESARESVTRLVARRRHGKLWLEIDRATEAGTV